MEENNPLWVDWGRRILSFNLVIGYEKVWFRTHEEMMAFALEKAFDGFRIQ